MERYILQLGERKLICLLIDGGAWLKLLSHYKKKMKMKINPDKLSNVHLLEYEEKYMSIHAFRNIFFFCKLLRIVLLDVHACFV